ncbi:MAG TPA: DNA polymerase I [Prolixibacteraceae bacterium]|nr:DNA polymerase I [Prolixibacteraceae bacterium]
METDNSQSKKLFVIDAYALIYRSYFAFIRNPRFNSKGLNTSAILGFVNSLEQVLNTEKPSHLAVAFDVHAETFRHKMFDQYKANRDEMPEDIRLAVPIIRNIVKAYNIPIVEKAGFEADDVIGTIALKAENEGFTTYMMTPDKDYAQLVDSNTFMYKPPKNGNNPEIWGIDEVNENFQIDQPSQVIEILGLMGDSADNIPGCPGVGPKTAMKLIGDYKSIEGIYQNIDKLKGKLKENLIEHKEQVFLSRELVIINTKVPIDIDFEEMKIAEPDKDQLMALFQELEFRTLASKLNSAQPITVKTSNSTPGLPTQGSLFGSDEIQTVASSINYESIETTKHQYIKIENASQRASLRAELAVSSSFCFDTETTGIDPHISDLVCMSFAIKPHQAFCVLLPNDRTETIKILDEFRLIFEDENIEKIGQNIKYDMLMLKQYGINVKGKLFDTMIAHYLLQPELRHNLDYLCEQYLNYKKVATEELIGAKGKNQRTMRSVETDTLVKYACEDADLTLQLKNKLATELTNNELSDLFNNIEMPLVHVLTEMEASGVKIDPDALNEYAVSLKEQIIQLEKEIHELAGVDFLISSPKQLGEILFDRLKIDPNAKKTKTKQYSTGEEVLEKLADKHPIINKVLEFRGLKKLLNTYVEALPKLINQRSGKIHTSFNQAIASTGRLSSTNPNLQNIPIRDDNGREIRKAFIPTEPGMLYLSADYSQIELRIMAALSKDPNMIEAFANNIDIHAATASKIFKIPVTEISSDMRRKAKTANFGIIYGISAFGLSQRLNISRTEAKELIDGYFEAFPKVKEYMEKSIDEARKNEMVKTLLGRKRYLVDINSANAVVRGVAERNAINAPIQGSAADIIKIAMINIQKQLEKENLKSKMILQVHDELNFDVYPNELEQLKSIVKTTMENAIELDVPLTVEMNHGKNWLEAH